MQQNSLKSALVSFFGSLFNLFAHIQLLKPNFCQLSTNKQKANLNTHLLVKIKIV